MQIIRRLAFLLIMTWPFYVVGAAMAAEESGAPAVIAVLTARLAQAATPEEASEIAGALNDAYGESASPSAEVLLDQAAVVAGEGDRQSALYKLDRSLLLDANLVAAYVLRAEVRLAEGDVQGSFEDAMAAVERAPTWYAGLSALANAFEARGQYASALATSREAFRFNPQDEELSEQLDRHERLARGVGL